MIWDRLNGRRWLRVPRFTKENPFSFPFQRKEGDSTVQSEIQECGEVKGKGSGEPRKKGVGEWTLCIGPEGEARTT